MNKIKIGDTFEASEIGLGCMRQCRVPKQEAKKNFYTALDLGINYFDHADVYGFGASEELYGEFLHENPSLRPNIFLQSKCTLIRDTEKTLYLDTTKKHILESVDGSLKRLQTDYLDVFVLHQPDTLMEPEEIAEAFDLLHTSGKVRYFGVSNFNRMELEYLQSCLHQKLLVNQLQVSVAHTELIDSANSIKLNEKSSVDHNGSVFTYMRMEKITVQAWSPLQMGFYGGVFMGHPAYPNLNEVAERLAEEKKVTHSAVGIAWLLRHPAKIQPMLGTTNPDHLKAMCAAVNITLSRAEWYELYRASLTDEGKIQVGNSNPKKNS